MKKLQKLLAMVMLTVMTFASLASFTALAAIVPDQDNLTVPISAVIKMVNPEPDPVEKYVIHMEADGDFPMPAGAAGRVYEQKRTGVGNVVFPSIKYSDLGIYTYRIWQIVEEPVNPDVVHDSSIYYLKVSVVWDEKTEKPLIYIALRHNDENADEKVQEIEFTNEHLLKSVELKKKATEIHRGDQVLDPAKVEAQPGDTIVYTITLRNTGAVKIPKGFVITDTLTVTKKDKTKVTIEEKLETTKDLYPAAMVSAEEGRTDQEEFQYQYVIQEDDFCLDNAVTAEFTLPPPPVHTPVQSMEMEKTAYAVIRGEEIIMNPTTVWPEDTIIYTITVTSTGEADIPAGTVVTDTLTITNTDGSVDTVVTPLTIENALTTENPTVALTYQYEVQEDDSVLNNVVTSTIPGPPPPPVINPVLHMELTKTLTQIMRNGAAVTDLNSARVGDEITYTITVKNTGEADLPKGTKITDTLTIKKTDGSTVTIEKVMETSKVLHPGESEELKYYYTVEPDDASLNNVATSEIPDTPPTPPITTPIQHMTLAKTLTEIKRNGAAVTNLDSAQPGDEITYTITVKNTGEADLPKGTKITDTLTIKKRDGSTETIVKELETTKVLKTGESEDLKYTYTVKAEDAVLNNVATSEIPDTPPTPPVITPVQHVALAKTLTEINRNGAAVEDLNSARPGDVITYTITVTNDSEAVIPAGLKVTDQLTITKMDGSTEIIETKLYTTKDLKPGESEELTYTYTVKAEDRLLNNVAITSIPETPPETPDTPPDTPDTPPDTPDTPPDTPDTPPETPDIPPIITPPVITPIQHMTLAKTLTEIARFGEPVADLSFAQAGDVVTYTITVTNIGEADLPAGTKITDTLTITKRDGSTETIVTELETTKVLKPGESEDLQYTYTVKAEDHELNNVATSEIPDTPPTPPVITPVQHVALAKTLTEINRNGESVSDLSSARPGDVITYTITVTNDSETVIPAGLKVTDQLTITRIDGSTETIETVLYTTKDLNPGDSEALTYTYTVQANDWVLNNVAITSIPETPDTPPEDPDNPDNPDIPDIPPVITPPVITPIQHISLAKTLTEINRNGESISDLSSAQVGDVITYTITVKNIGEAVIPAGMKVTDTLTITKMDGSTETIETELETTKDLKPGDSEELKYTYTVQEDDLILNNVAISEIPWTPDAPPDTPDTPPVTPDTPIPTPPVITPVQHITLEKTLTEINRDGESIADLAQAWAGDVITYTITVTNNGEADIPAGTKIIDTMTVTKKDGSTVTIVTELETTKVLKPGDSEDLTFTYTVQEDDFCLDNVATSEIPGTPPTPDVHEPIQSLALEKTATERLHGDEIIMNPTTAEAGDIIVYTVTVTNDGEADIPAGTKITDTMTVTKKDGSTVTIVTELETTQVLKTGESEALTYTYTVQEDDLLITNVVVSDIPGPPVPDVDEPVSSLLVEKVAVSEPANGNAYMEDEIITYTIVVTNDGLTDLTDVIVTDEMTGDTWTVESLAAGESVEFEANYVVTAEDAAAGSVLNVATATATDPDGAPLEHEDEDEQPTVESTELTISKQWIDEYQLTIYYRYWINGHDAGIAAPTIVRPYHAGDVFQIWSPDIEGYRPNIWSVGDGDVALVAHPENVTVNLFADGVMINTVTLNEAGNWTETLTGLPAAWVNEEGEQIPITYTWEEVTVPMFSLESSVTEGTETVLTNAADDVEITVYYVPTTDIIPDIDTPLGIGQVYINIHDCLE